MRFIDPVHSGLLKYDANNELQLDLAEDYEIDGSGTVYTFSLRDGLKAHNGNAITSEDVVASLLRIRDQGARGWQLSDVIAVDAYDERTVAVTLATPSVPLLHYLAHPLNAILDSESLIAADSGTELISNDAGIGPMRIQQVTSLAIATVTAVHSMCWMCQRICHSRSQHIW